MIPLTRDVADLIGPWAEGVENRSLLHEKYALPKVWGVENGEKLNDAGRWSVLRIVTRGSDLLRGDAQRLRREAGGRNAQPDVAERKERDAHVAEKMASVAKIDLALAKVGNDNARRLLADLDKSFNGMVVTFEFTLGARMMVNLAGGVVENAGIALDRCFGLPLIPGSAIKGITRAQALWEIRESKGDEKLHLLRLALLLFGYGAHDLRGDFGWAGGHKEASVIAEDLGATDFKGCACFLPGYPITPPTLVVDMVNPHYPDYYSGRNPRAEYNEKPIPNYFPAVEAGSEFGFAVLLNRVPKAGVSASDLLNQAKQWLQRSLTRKGIGAKTAAGYGWFELGRKAATAPQSPAATTSLSSAVPVAASVSQAEALIAKWRGKLATNANFPAALPELVALPDDAELKRVFEAVIPENERRRNKKNSPYWQSFTSGRQGESGKKILSRLDLKLT